MLSKYTRFYCTVIFLFTVSGYAFQDWLLLNIAASTAYKVSAVDQCTPRYKLVSKCRKYGTEMAVLLAHHCGIHNVDLKLGKDI